MADESSWPELVGSKNWDGLLDPLDLSLRRLILRCGDFCQSTHDAFNYDANSKYYGSCRYGKSSFFTKLMLYEHASNYQVESYIYGTAEVKTGMFPWDKDENTTWIGYIAVSKDDVSKTLGRREIYVVWRGTETNYEGKDDLDPLPTSAEPLLRPGTKPSWFHTPNVMSGWLTIYTTSNPNSQFTKLSAREQIQRKIQELTERYKDESLYIIVTGYSLGATLGTLTAFDLAENVVDKNIPVSAFVFESPFVGNEEFHNRVKQHSNLKILRIWNTNDVLPINYPTLLGYVHVGTGLEVDNRKSPHLKTDAKYDHNLESVLHVVAGWNGKDGEFELKVKRSLPLVNRSSSALKDEYQIPEAWWSQQNKGMVLDENGEWILAPPAEEDLPVPEFD